MGIERALDWTAEQTGPFTPQAYFDELQVLRPTHTITRHTHTITRPTHPYNTSYTPITRPTPL